MLYRTEVGSLERIREYLNIAHEPISTKEGKPPAYWPASGSLSVEKLSARYSKDGPEVLKELSFAIKSGERIGVGAYLWCWKFEVIFTS